MNTQEERQRAVAAIDAHIAALIEDGVPADSSRIRALKAKRAVAQKSTKAIKRSVRKAREREAARAAATDAQPARPPAAKHRGTSPGPIRLVPASTADSKRFQSLSAKERKRVEAARIEVRQALKWCDEPSAEAVKRAIAHCDVEMSALIDRGVGYDSAARTDLRYRGAQLKELAAVFASRRRTSPPSELELAFLLDAYLERRRRIRRGPENVVGVLDVRSGGAPSLGKRK